jgi:hypothetical protein
MIVFHAFSVYLVGKNCQGRATQSPTMCCHHTYWCYVYVGSVSPGTLTLASNVYTQENCEIFMTI